MFEVGLDLSLPLEPVLAPCGWRCPHWHGTSDGVNLVGIILNMFSTSAVSAGRLAAKKVAPRSGSAFCIMTSAHLLQISSIGSPGIHVIHPGMFYVGSRGVSST
jgi:hypothetical protein